MSSFMAFILVITISVVHEAIIYTLGKMVCQITENRNLSNSLKSSAGAAMCRFDFGYAERSQAIPKGR